MRKLRLVKAKRARELSRLGKEEGDDATEQAEYLGDRARGKRRAMPITSRLERPAAAKTTAISSTSTSGK